jgi:cytochrome c oxidase subunit 2
MLTPLANSLYFPPSASTVAPHVDALFNGILIVTAFFCLLIFVLMIAFAIKFRHRPGKTIGAPAGHSTALELTWTIIPIIICIVIFYYGFKGYLDETVVPPNAYEIQVHSQMWNWSFEYPNGHIDPELHIPKGQPVHLILESADVVHSLYIPAFRVQKMTVPGRYNRIWVQATRLGEYPIYCAQYCGTQHSQMMSKCVVHDPADFAKWLEVASNPEKQKGFTPEKAGKQVMTAHGCFQCHTTNGSALIGPTLKDVFGSDVLLQDGSHVHADENYVHESILYPQKKIVKGFGPVMPSFLGTLKDREIGWIIAYLKSISSHYHAAPAVPTTAPSAPTTPAAVPEIKK